MARDLILGIETSCDETSAAVVEKGRYVKSNIIASQINLHRVFGGVVPELASRKHLELLDRVIKKALEKAEVNFSDLQGIAVTYGPGLVGSLLIGIVAAKTLSWALGLPLIGVNHILGHIYSNLLEPPELEPPLLCLTVSGGHTDLIYTEEWGQYQILGRTRDDAAGESFDKVARFLGLGYPGGPAIERIAETGNPERYPLPRPDLGDDQFGFSFSGLKTAVINLAHNLEQKEGNIPEADIAASFQKTVVDILLERVERALKDFPVDKVLLAGGVAANKYLRGRLEEMLKQKGASLYYPSLEYCTDNAAMVAGAGYFLLKQGKTSTLDLDAYPQLKL